MHVEHNLQLIKSKLPPKCTLIAVSKTKSNSLILEAYNANHRQFGENKVQELVQKYELLPKDIEWHMIGHLQTNKVKYIAPFVHLIHGVDSEKLLSEINKQASKINRKIHVLIQIHIATEESKFGFSFEEANQLFNSNFIEKFPFVAISGLMGMATNTDNEDVIRKEFHELNNYFLKLKSTYNQINTLSMGMSSDWKIAIEEGSNMVRVGSAIFGERMNN